MNLTLTLAGCAADWRFRDSPRLEAWLAGRPWLDRSEVRLVRVPGPAIAVDFAHGLRRAVLGHDEGRGGVEVRLLDADRLAEGLGPALAEALEVPAEGATRLELLRRCAGLLAHRPALFVAPPSADPRPGLLDDAAGWLDRLEKTAGALATVVLFDTPRARLAGEAFDLSVGLPADPLLPSGGRPDTGSLWRGYLHRRLAWELAGDPEGATARADEAASLGVGDDAGFEYQLNEAADTAWREVPADARREMQEYLDHSVCGAKPRAMLAQVATRLERRGYLWRPPGGDAVVPVPWVARALLRTDAVPAGTFHLRGCLVCVPLAHELLARCFDLEARERAALWAGRGGRSAPEVATERWRRFQMPGSFEAGLYPPLCPAVPDDAWPFATFGEFLTALVPARDPRRDACYRLLNLRNHLAHGHYAGWAVVLALRAVEEQLLA